MEPGQCMVFMHEMISQLADCEIDGIKGTANAIITIQSTQVSSSVVTLHLNSLNHVIWHHHNVVLLSLTNKLGLNTVPILQSRVAPLVYLFPGHLLSAVFLSCRSIWCLTVLLQNHISVLQWIKKLCLQLVGMVPTHLQLQPWQESRVIGMILKVHAYHQ